MINVEQRAWDALRGLHAHGDEGGRRDLPQQPEAPEGSYSEGSY